MAMVTAALVQRMSPVPTAVVLCSVATGTKSIVAEPQRTSAAPVRLCSG